MNNHAARRVLLTGCSDFFGRACVSALRAQGFEVRATRARATDTESSLDVLDFRAVDEAVAQCDAVVHMAARRTYNADEYPAARRLHIEGALNVARSAKAHGAKMVLLGTSEEYGPAVGIPYVESAECAPVSVYGQSKLSATIQLLNDAPETVVVLRPSVIYGANQPGFMLVASCFRGAMTEGIIRLKGGQQTRDHVYVDDAAKAVVQAVLHHEGARGQIINIGSGQECSVLSIAEQVVALVGRGEIVLDPPSERPGDVQRMYLSTERAAQKLQWRAQTMLTEGLQQTLKELQKQRQMTEEKAAHA